MSRHQKKRNISAMGLQISCTLLKPIKNYQSWKECLSWSGLPFLLGVKYLRHLLQETACFPVSESLKINVHSMFCKTVQILSHIERKSNPNEQLFMTDWGNHWRPHKQHPCCDTCWDGCIANFDCWRRRRMLYSGKGNCSCALAGMLVYRLSSHTLRSPSRRRCLLQLSWASSSTRPNMRAKEFSDSDCKHAIDYITHLSAD